MIPDEAIESTFFVLAGEAARVGPKIIYCY